MKSLRLICLVFSVVVTGFCRAAVEETEDQTIRIEPLVAGGSDTVEFNWVSGIARITNDFVVHHRGAVLTAHRGELNLETHEMTAEGGVFFGRRLCCSLLTDPFRDMLVARA